MFRSHFNSVIAILLSLLLITLTAGELIVVNYWIQKSVHNSLYFELYSKVSGVYLSRYSTQT